MLTGRSLAKRVREENEGAFCRESSSIALEGLPKEIGGEGLVTEEVTAVFKDSEEKIILDSSTEGSAADTLNK